MDKEEGLREIETTRWTFSADCKTLELVVHDYLGEEVHCFLTLRPQYCDRGHIQLLIDGQLDLDSSDRFPRYFFSFLEADEHTRMFLKWRLWKERTYLVVWPPGEMADTPALGAGAKA